MFFGWEGVGVASYLLIGFWYKKELAHSGDEGFVVNRVGDFGFAWVFLPFMHCLDQSNLTIFLRNQCFATTNLIFLVITCPHLKLQAFCCSLEQWGSQPNGATYLAT